jgi:predicted transcriptional regulator
VAEFKTIDPRPVAEIVGSYVSHNSIAASELPNLIAIIHRSLAELGSPRVCPLPHPLSPSTDPTAGTSWSALTAGGAA